MSMNKRPPIKRHADPYKNAKSKRPPPRDADRYADDETPEQVEGRNAVIEALRAGVPLNKIYIAKNSDDDNKSSPLKYIAALARENGAVVADVDRRKLDAMSRTGAHQGVIAVAAAAEYASVEDILERAAERGEPALIVVCDEISDPHNLGAIIRTAEAVGAHGVIIPKRRGAGLTGIVAKASAGAAFHLPAARVANLAQAIGTLKKAGVWIYGAAQDGEKSLWATDFSGPAALVIGAEGAGLGRLIRESCDFTVSIPMSGKVQSLNASVAASVMLYEAVRQRQSEAVAEYEC